MPQKTYQHTEPFLLESGLFLNDLRLHYCTYGTLNAKRDNVIWVCHALTANAEVEDWWAGLFGKGNLFDPEKYFVICVNNLGSPYGSSSPNQINSETNVRYGLSFPAFTLRDTSDAIQLLMDHLKIENIHLLIGGSCGGNIALEMAISRGFQIKNLALLCCSAKETPWTIGIHHAQRIALDGDPQFHQNKTNVGQAGLKAARAFALPFYRTAISMNSRQQEDDLNKLNDFKASSYLTYQGNKFVKRFDAHCYYKLLNALDTHNVGRNRESILKALKRIKTKTLVIGIDSDIFIPVEEQHFLAAHIPNATYAEINSIFGHDAFLIETKQIFDHITAYLPVVR